MARISPLALAFVFSLAACGGKHFVSTRNADPVLLAGAQPPTEVRAAIVRAMADRRFTAESDTPGHLVARYERGDEMLRVAIDYGDTQFVVRYVSSAGYEGQPAGGEVLLDSRWQTHANKLRHAISEELARPERERVAAEKSARRHEDYVAASRVAEAQANAAAAQAQANAAEAQVQAQANAAAAPAPVAAPVLIQSNTTVQDSQQTLTCCINGRKYSCPGEDAFKHCISHGPTRCKHIGGC